MSKIWSALVDLVENYFTDENDCVRKYNDEGISLDEAIFNYLKEADCSQFIVDGDTIFESPGYDTGVVTAAWIEGDGFLHNIMFQWECMQPSGNKEFSLIFYKKNDIIYI